MKTSTHLFRSTRFRANRAFVRLAFLASAICMLSAATAGAQISFSIEVQGATIGSFASMPAGTMIGAGDVLAPGAGPPRIRTTAAAMGIASPLLRSGPPELDALSFGNDSMIDCGEILPLYFSVDEFAVGVPGVPTPPNVYTEGASGNQEASADVFSTNAQPAPPICPGVASGNTGVADGDGALPFPGPGLNLAEANPPTPGAGLDPGDNLDALACGKVTDDIYFSLDADWADPIEGPSIHRSTAPDNGFSPGAILVSSAGGGGVTLFASASALGLGETDDLDALLLRDNGNGEFDPSETPLDWLGGGTDMVVFSVRRGSPIVGTLDAIHGVAIGEGDLLTVTNGGSSPPGILIFAEDLGLWTARSNDGDSPSGFDDNLDALSAKSCFDRD